MTDPRTRLTESEPIVGATDYPRAALAEAAYEDRPPLGKRPIPQPPRLRKEWEAWAGRMQPRLAERGVLLVPAEFVATIQRMIEDGHPNDREWFDIVVRALAALSDEVTA